MDYSLFLYLIPILLISFVIWAQVSPKIEKTQYQKFIYEFKDLDSEKIFKQKVNDIKLILLKLKNEPADISKKDSVLKMIEELCYEVKSIQTLLMKIHKFDLSYINAIIVCASALSDSIEKAGKRDSKEILFFFLSKVPEEMPFYIDQFERLEKSILYHE